ncbi:Uu.00g092230.m01.CDS01 [Anthostomella pinea]|uniref:Uu.00g092230.m01.CDS01 n=1 Tax=Anthostomella pinea TaxID=933095 RepID=A0AAI8VNX4_9PEZI|nr:Uu.00g092230.m01.CDS01 [Anthostomella pinea]
MPIVNRIKGGARYSELVSTILSHSPTTTGEVCEQSINLAARLLAMVEIGRSKSELFAERVLSWTEGTLQDFLSDHFGTLPVLKDDLVRLPKSFDAWSLQAVGGIDIGFTDNLADHLLLIEDDMKVLIYHHASFLKHQKNGVLPDGIAEETLNTLALLFPQSEFASPFRTKKRKRQWYQALRMGSTILVDEQLARCGNLRADSRQIERFKFWHDRLVVLKRAYDEATPRSISQWWYDRRNGVQWYTFWVAILVLMITTSLGVLQCVESALQVYKAYYPSGP